MELSNFGMDSHNPFGDYGGSRPLLRLIGGPLDGLAMIQIEEDPPEEIRHSRFLSTGAEIVECYRLDPSDPAQSRLIYHRFEVIDGNF